MLDATTTAYLVGPAHHGNLETRRYEVEGRTQQAFDWATVGHGGEPVDNIQLHWTTRFKCYR
jgi:hypothetical protein